MMRVMTKVLLIAVLLGGKIFIFNALAKAGEIPKPSLIVFFEKDKIRENGPTKVKIWLSNNSDHDLMDIRIHISGPDFLYWYKTNSSDTKIVTPLTFKSIPAHTTIKHSLIAKLMDGGEVGKFNILFAVEYQWKVEKRIHQSIVTIEKAIEIDILGTDKILGVPIAFASFIIPGLACLLILQLFKLPFTLNIKQDIKLIFSILVSISIMALSSLLKQQLSWEWLKYLDLSSQISIGKLFVLGGLGSAFGLIVGLIHLLIIKRKQKFERENRITHDDKDFAIIIEKILNLNPKYKGNAVLFQHKDTGIQYIGAHYAKITDLIYLVGSFMIDKKALSQEDFPKCLDKNGNILQKKAAILRIIKKANSQRGIKLEVGAFVKKIENMKEAYTTRVYMTLKTDEFIGPEYTSESRMNLVRVI
jgi:hypothetical protein